AEILKKWVKRAHELGNVVAVHAILKDAIDRAIESKADSLEHGTQITTQQLEKMANEKIVWVPTVPFWPLIIHPKFADKVARDLKAATFMTCNKIKQAKKLGVQIAFG